MGTEGWLRDLSRGEIDVSLLAPGNVVFLKKPPEGRLVPGGQFRRQEGKDGIAGTLDWASWSVFLKLVGDLECVTMGSFAAGLRIGVGIPLPRERGIFERMVVWSDEVKPEDGRSAAGCQEELVFQGDYQSALELMAGVRRLFQTELELMRIRRLTMRGATGSGQDLRIGSLGARFSLERLCELF